MSLKWGKAKACRPFPCATRLHSHLALVMLQSACSPPNPRVSRILTPGALPPYPPQQTPLELRLLTPALLSLVLWLCMILRKLTDEEHTFFLAQ